MATSQNFAEFVVEGLDADLKISFRKMFGEYAIYSDKKVVALICDNQLFVKPTETGREFIGEVEESPPYPSAKPSFLIANIEDTKWLSELLRITAKELPEPKPKKKKKK